MQNIPHKKRKIWILIFLIIISIIISAMSEDPKTPEKISVLSNAISETQIPEIPYLQFKSQEYYRSKYLSVKYTFDGKIHHKDDVADQIVEKMEKHGYRISVFNLSETEFYIIAINKRYHFSFDGRRNAFMITVYSND